MDAMIAQQNAGMGGPPRGPPPAMQQSRPTGPVVQQLPDGSVVMGATKPQNNQTPSYGDWFCSQCNDLQFARNIQCRRCGNSKEASLAAMPQPEGACLTEILPGDWFCVNCNDLQFARNDNCRRCGMPKEHAGDPHVMRSSQMQQQLQAQGIKLTFGPTGPRRPKIPEKQDDAIDIAAGTALMPIQHLETQWEHDKLRWSVAKYFRKAGEMMVWRDDKNLMDLLHEFTGHAFGTLVKALQDRVWLPQADFTLILDAAVKVLFPAELLAQVTETELEDAVLQAHDLAFEEARVMPAMWDMVSQEEKIDGKKNRNKVYTALETGRGAAIKSVTISPTDLSEEALLEEAATTWEKVQKFIHTWINVTIKEIKKTGCWDPSELLPPDTATMFFQVLLQSDTLPSTLSRALAAEGASVPSPFPFLDRIVEEAYESNTNRKRKKEWVDWSKIDWSTQEKKEDGTWAEKDFNDDPLFKTKMCWFFENGTCTYGDTCKDAHFPEELRERPENADELERQQFAQSKWYKADASAQVRPAMSAGPSWTVTGSGSHGASKVAFPKGGGKGKMNIRPVNFGGGGGWGW